MPTDTVHERPDVKDSASAAQKTRRALLIVRAGDRSLHRHWLDGDVASLRNFDLHVSYFGNKELFEITRGHDITATAEKGPKFTGLLVCLGKLGNRIDQYDYVGFPDDDLYADCTTWNRFFEIVHELQPSVAQPALHRSSFYTFPELLQVPGLLARWTNFVEVMMPVFSVSALQKALPYLGENKSGWGMDCLWPQLFESQNRTLCVVDQTPVLHTRAVLSGPLYGLLRDGSSSPFEELDEFLLKYQIERQSFKVYDAISANGGAVEEARFSAGYWLHRIRDVVRRRLSITEISASNWLHML
jgi:hypothetical protein